MSYRATDIFVPGGMPQFTYVSRSDRRLEETLGRVKENLFKLVTVTGTTKSGKTVLVNKVLPRNKAIWVDGGAIKSDDDFWNTILQSINGYTSKSNKNSIGTKTGVQGSIEGNGKLPFIASIKALLGFHSEIGKEISQNMGLTVSPRVAAISQLRNERIPIVIDDFHYLDRQFQGNIIRALKPLIFSGLPVVLIAIPHRRFDAVKVEREITGRLETIHVPTWEPAELKKIPDLGFPLLNVEIDESIYDLLIKEAYGSPHLIQDFCRSITETYSIEETLPKKTRITEISNDIFTKVADQTGKVIFEKLARGPRQRSDRLQRRLLNGSTADIYKVILLALVNLKPGLDSIGYETLRSAIREILADKIPEAHEVTRVLEQMSKIAASDEASTPVIDWDKHERILHITDPYFAFFLKWGNVNS